MIEASSRAAAPIEDEAFSIGSKDRLSRLVSLNDCILIHNGELGLQAKACHVLLPRVLRVIQAVIRVYI
ncbi:hypothetical protein TgHK011_008989 [Trichoderma gracile]|nr:hypothetical protein TgHK011_008989 [Trichoderma gracile]